MKRILTLLTALLLVLSLGGCGSQDFDRAELLESEYMGLPLSDEILSEITNKSVNSGTRFLELHFKNTGGTDYSFDAGRRLEVMLDGIWYIVPDKSPAINMALFQLPAGDDGELRLQLEGHYENLPSGKYRVIKIFTDPKGRESLCSSEFQIQ